MKVELGLHQARRPVCVGTLLPLRAARQLQPLRGGLVPGAAGGGRSGQGSHRGELPAAASRAGPCYHIHADRGPSMTPKPVALLLATRGVLPSHTQPQVSDDTPFSNAQCKTLKYRPDFPSRFSSCEDAEVFYQRFFSWNNTEHWHSSLGLMTPADMYDGRVAAKWQQRAEVLHAAYARIPSGSPRGLPVPPPCRPRRGSTSRPCCRRLGPLITAAHKFPAVAVSFTLTPSAASGPSAKSRSPTSLTLPFPWMRNALS